MTVFGVDLWFLALALSYLVALGLIYRIRPVESSVANETESESFQQAA